MNKRKEQKGGHVFMYTTIFLTLIVLGLLVYIYMSQRNTKPDLYDFSPGGTTSISMPETAIVPANAPVTLLGGRYRRFR